MAEDDSATTPPVAPAPAAPTALTQETVNAIVAREADKAQRSAAKALAESLGFSSKAELESFIKATRDERAAQMTEVERKAKEAEERMAEANRIAAEANARVHHLTVTEALRAAGAQGDVAKLVPALGVEIGASAEDITAAVNAFAETFPALFGTAAPPPAPRPSSEPASGGPAPSRSAPTTLLEAGKQAALARQGRTA